MRAVTNVVQLGPGLQARGGISSVARLIVEHAGSGIGIRHIATMEDGPSWRRLGVFVQALGQLRAACKVDEPLVVHIHFPARGGLREALLAWITLRAGRSLIVHAHGDNSDQFLGQQPSLVQGLLRRTFARADKLVVLSTRWRDFYGNHCGLDAGRIMVLHNPVALPRSVPPRTNRQKIQLLFLGRICARNGAFDLLRAWLALPGALRERTRLVFAGDGEIERLRDAARVAGDAVEVHSWIDAQRRDALFAQSDVFVLPSYHEGVPMALLEAMAHGLPVVTARVGGIADIVDDQVEGLLTKPGEHDQLVGVLRALIEDENRRLALGRNARIRAERFDIDRYSTDLLRLYRQILRAHEGMRRQPLPGRVL
jgi:glycosyltransferase involved in cell wall biosynthesis